MGKALKITIALTHNSGKPKIGPAIIQAIKGCSINFDKLIPHALPGGAVLFWMRNKPIEIKAHGVEAAAKNEITCAIGSYKVNSLAAHIKPATGAMSNGLVHKDLITLKTISCDFLCDKMPISINTVAKANITNTMKVEIMAGASPS